MIALDGHMKRILAADQIRATVARACELALAEDFEGAAPLFREAIAAGDQRPEILAGYATCRMAQGFFEEAIPLYREALRTKPDLLKARNNLIFCLDQQADTTAADAYEERRAWWKHHGAPVQHLCRPQTNDPDPERPLRVGYISADFRLHSAAFGFGPVILRHTPEIEPICYSTTEPKLYDDMTRLFQERAPFHDIRDLTWLELADRIRADRIDILVDLSAFTGGNRLQTFCVKPAPVQITAWGYVLGTGLNTMDAILGDPVAMPHDQQPYFRERIVHLPVIIPYVAPGYAPPVAPLKARDEGLVVFGSFARASKVNSSTLWLWAETLKATPNSWLLLKDRSYENEEFCASIRRRMAADQIDPERIIFGGYTKHAKHLETYQHIDLALDGYPASGGVTTVEGLWMGVPTLAFQGERVCSRVSSSVLTVLGLEAFIARNEHEYPRMAAQWVTEHRAELAAIRLGLRERMERSPLNRGYVEATEAIYRDLWRNWCGRTTRRRRTLVAQGA